MLASDDRGQAAALLVAIAAGALGGAAGHLGGRALHLAHQAG